MHLIELGGNRRKSLSFHTQVLILLSRSNEQRQQFRVLSFAQVKAHLNRIENEIEMAYLRWQELENMREGG